MKKVRVVKDATFETVRRNFMKKQQDVVVQFKKKEVWVINGDYVTRGNVSVKLPKATFDEIFKEVIQGGNKD